MFPDDFHAHRFARRHERHKDDAAISQPAHAPPAEGDFVNEEVQCLAGRPLYADEASQRKTESHANRGSPFVEIHCADR